MSLSPTHNLTPVHRGRFGSSAVIWGLVVLTIASMLLCMPALHSATGLHDDGGTLDAFDYGIIGSDTMGGGLFIIALGSLLLIVLKGADTRRRAWGLADYHESHVSYGRTPANSKKARLMLRAGLASRESDADLPGFPATASRGMVMTLRPLVNQRGTGGSLFFCRLHDARVDPFRATGLTAKLTGAGTLASGKGVAPD